MNDDEKFKKVIKEIKKKEPIKMVDRFAFNEEKASLRDEWSESIMRFEVAADKFVFDMGDHVIIAKGDNLKKFIRVMKVSLAFYKEMGVTR